MVARHPYSLVSALNVRPGYPGPIFKIEHNPVNLYKSLIYLLSTSVATALEGYASEGQSQRISAEERAREGKCRDGMEVARYT